MPNHEFNYNETFRLSSGSFMQLLLFYNTKVSNDVSDGSKWQDFVYPKLKDLFASMLECFEGHINSLMVKNEEHKQMIHVNFSGYDNYKMPVVVVPKNIKPHINYKNARVRDIMAHLDQRLYYLSICSVPKRYTTEEELRVFKQIQELSKQLLDHELKEYKEKWRNICNEAYLYAGIEKKDK